MIPLREIRRQIQSIQKIGHITRAMKTVSAIRLMKVQSTVTQQRPYAMKLREIVSDLVARTAANAHPLLQPAKAEPENGNPAPRRIGCLALGSDRGLCGAFNAELEAEIVRFANLHKDDQIELTVIGKRLYSLLRTRHIKVDRFLDGFYQDLSYEKVTALAGEYKKRYLEGALAEFRVIYMQFRSTARQKPAAELMLPIGTAALTQEPLFPEYRYEPDEHTVLDNLLPLYYDREAWRVFLESEASEHVTRMRAMDMATTNAGTLVKSLTLVMNKARQELITRELADISIASEALKGQ